MSLLFALISLVLAVADGSDLNPHSKAYYASPCGKWTFRRAFIKSALPLLAAALPNYIHLRVNISLPCREELECAFIACLVTFLLSYCFTVQPQVHYWYSMPCTQRTVSENVLRAGMVVSCPLALQLLDSNAACTLLPHMDQLCVCVFLLHVRLGCFVAGHSNICPGTVEYIHHCLLLRRGAQSHFYVSHWFKVRL